MDDAGAVVVVAATALKLLYVHKLSYKLHFAKEWHDVACRSSSSNSRNVRENL